MNTSCQSGLRHMRTTIPSALANRASARPAPCAHAFPPPLRSIKRPKPLPAYPSLPPSPTPPPPPLSSRRSVHHHARMKLRARAGPIIPLQGARRSIPTPIRCSAHEPIPNPLLGGGAGPLPSPRYTSFALLPARHPPTSPGARHTFTLARSASPELRCTSHTRRPRSWVKVSSSHNRAFVATRHCVSTPPLPIIPGAQHMTTPARSPVHGPNPSTSVTRGPAKDSEGGTRCITLPAVRCAVHDIPVRSRHCRHCTRPLAQPCCVSQPTLGAHPPHAVLVERLLRPASHTLSTAYPALTLPH
jgi:hypothetical protein